MSTTDTDLRPEEPYLNAIPKNPNPAPIPAKKKSGDKYHKEIKPGVVVDVYDVLKAFGVACPGRQQAIKKLLFTGMRGHKDAVTDLKEARDAVDRAIELASSDSCSQ